MILPASSARPLVAIVTPVYNGAKEHDGVAHIERAIQAVQAQTYRPLVHCIVDNASSDATAEIIARYAAKSDVPIIVKRNAETIPFAANWNAVLELIPPEAEWFRQLHADDTLPPHAIEAMVELAMSDPEITMVAGAERMNGVDRPHHFPKECSVYDASNAIARTLVDEAHIPSAHILYRRDMLRDGEEFYPTEYVECGIEAIYRVLSRGGRMGFVHQHVADTIRYAESGSLIHTLGKKVKKVIWEKLLTIEQYGPATLTNTEYRRVRRRYLRIYYRRLLWWMVTGRMDVAKRDLVLLAERGIRPSLWDYLESAAVWPKYLLNKLFAKPHAAPRWPADALKPAPRLPQLEAANDSPRAARMRA